MNNDETPPSNIVIPFNYLRVDSFISETIATNYYLVSCIECRSEAIVEFSKYP